jgi:hypothetical protein
MHYLRIEIWGTRDDSQKIIFAFQPNLASSGGIYSRGESNMARSSELEDEFGRDMELVLKREKEVGLISVRFRQMIERWGAIGAARRLLEADRELPPNTFTYLRSIDRLDLAMEYYVVMPKYGSLLSEAERQIAAFRLRAED